MFILNFISTPYIILRLSLRSTIADTDFSCIANAQDFLLQIYTVNMASPVVSNAKMEKNKHFS